MKYIFTLLSLVCFITANAQITWTLGMNISTNTYGNMHPRMSLDGAGNPMVIWGRMSDESVFFSKWNGTMFSTPVKINPSWMTIATQSWMGPDIASHGDTVYVIVKRTPEAIDSNRIFVFSSFNGGITFNTPVEIGLIADSISRFPTITTDSIGNPIVAYMKFNAAFGDSRWVVTKSNDYGNTFTVDVKASGWGNSAGVCDCCPGAIVSSGNNCAMLYRNNNSNIRDTWAGISTDNASTFTKGFALENNNWMINNCPSTGPDGVIVGDTLYSVFMNAASGMALGYFSKFSIGSDTLGTVTNLTGTIVGLTQQNYPRIASDGKAMAIVWKQIVNNGVQLPILFTNDIALGFASSYDTVDLNNITNGDVALSNGNVFVVWQDDNSGTVKFRTGTYIQSTTGISSHSFGEGLGVSLYPNPTTDELNIILQNKNIFTLNIFNSIAEKIYSAQATSNLKL